MFVHSFVYVCLHLPTFVATICQDLSPCLYLLPWTNKAFRKQLRRSIIWLRLFSLCFSNCQNHLCKAKNSKENYLLVGFPVEWPLFAAHPWLYCKSKLIGVSLVVSLLTWWVYQLRSLKTRSILSIDDIGLEFFW